MEIKRCLACGAYPIIDYHNSNANDIKFIFVCSECHTVRHAAPKAMYLDTIEDALEMWNDYNSRKTEELAVCPWCSQEVGVAILDGKKCMPYGANYVVHCVNLECPVQPCTRKDQRDVVMQLWNSQVSEEENSEENSEDEQDI